MDGDYRFADRFEDYSRAAEDAEIEENRRFAREALLIHADGRGPDDPIRSDMIARNTTTRADLLESANALFDVVAKGAVKIEVNQTHPLRDAAQAHRDLEARKTTGSTILLP
jgi:NADPH:quinone reductase-like Zn-dependent oxidoreductase